MSGQERAPPYDFSDWQLGEDALSDVEVVAWELIEQAQDKTLRHNWPDFSKLHDAVAKLVRDQLLHAFQEHHSGNWRIDLSGEATLRWISEIHEEDEQPVITLTPRQLIPLLIAPLSERLSQLPISEYIEPQPRYSAGDDFDWDANWLLAFAAAKQWHRAILASLKGLKALQAERRERLAEEASEHADPREDDA
jgi:hypothetical protein